MKKLLIGLLATLVFTTGAVAVSVSSEPEYTPKSSPTVEAVPPSSDELLRLVNKERAKVGVAPLVIDERVQEAAQLKADDMLKNNYFDHVDANGKHGYTYVIDTGADCTYAGENITWNTHVNDSKTAVEAWVGSKSHYEAMIDAKYTTTGFGIADRKIVQHFCVAR